MSYQLPESFYRESTRRRLDIGRLRIWGILLILFSVWNLFTPYGIIRRNNLSREFPNSQFGIQNAFINADSELVLQRRGYVDRVSQYIYDLSGNLISMGEKELYTGERLDSLPSISSQYRTSGVGIDIKPSELTLERIRVSSHRLRGKKNLPDRTDTRVPLNAEGRGDIRSIKEVASDGPAIEHLEIRFLSASEPQPHALLFGHQYLPFRDAHCYVDPLLGDQYDDNVLYITTDSQRYLHRILLDPSQDAVNWAALDRTAVIADEMRDRFDAHLCHHPLEPPLLLFNSAGLVSIYDNKSLELIDSRQLDGNWEREYASLFQATSFYSDEFGIALTRLEAFRYYRLLALMLLCGVILTVISYLGSPGGDNELDTDEVLEAD